MSRERHTNQKRLINLGEEYINMNSIKANEGYDEIEAFNSSLVPSEIKSSGIIGIGSEYSFEEWKSFLQSKGVNATDQEFQAFWDDWGADEDMEKSQFEESKTTETTESEKATEIKEEFSENAYLQLINETMEIPLEVHGRFYNSAEEWKEHDPIAFREDYMVWIDGNEKDGVDTGDDGYESNTKGIPTEDIETLHDVGSLYIEWNKDFDGSKQDFIDYAEAKGFKPKDAGSIYETQHSENEQWQYGGELKADEDFGQFTIQNPDLSTDKYPIDQEGFGRASWEDAEIDHRKRWLIKNGFDSNAEDDAHLPYYSLPSMVRAVLAKDLHVGGIQAMGESKASELATTIEDMKYDNEPMRSGDGRGILGDPLYPESTKKGEPKLDTEEEIDDYIKNGKEDEDKDEAEERSKADIQAMKDLGAGDFAEDIPDDMSVDQWLGGDDNDDKDEAEEIIGAMGELEELKDTYGSSPNADPTTTPLEDHSGTDDSSDTQYSNEADDDEMSDGEWQELQADLDSQDEHDKKVKKFKEQGLTDDEIVKKLQEEDTVEESFGDCGCKDTKKAKMSWESARDSDKQYWLRELGEDEGYSYYYFEHLPKRLGESFVNKFKVEQSEDRGWSKIPALERADLLKKLGFPPRDAELVANLEYPQLSESLKKDVNDAVSVKKRVEESQREEPDGQLSFENDLYSNMYDGYLKRRGQRVDTKKN